MGYGIRYANPTHTNLWVRGGRERGDFAPLRPYSNPLAAPAEERIGAMSPEFSESRSRGFTPMCREPMPNATIGRSGSRRGSGSYPALVTPLNDGDALSLYEDAVWCGGVCNRDQPRARSVQRLWGAPDPGKAPDQRPPGVAPPRDRRGVRRAAVPPVVAVPAVGALSVTGR